MKKPFDVFSWIVIIITVFYWVILPNIYVYSHNIDKLIEIGKLHKASKLMRNEIIRQLKEKEGMTFEEYILKQYFKRLLEEIK